MAIIRTRVAILSRTSELDRTEVAGFFMRTSALSILTLGSRKRFPEPAGGFLAGILVYVETA
jgi:hypothetical protein